MAAVPVPVYPAYVKVAKAGKAVLGQPNLHVVQQRFPLGLGDWLQLVGYIYERILRGHACEPVLM